MRTKAGLSGCLATLLVLALGGAAAAQEPLGDGEGVDSNLLWPAPGPGNFPTLQSSDIVGHTGVSFGAVFGFYRQPLGVERTSAATGATSTDWVVEHAFAGDFLWAFGLFDWVQLGVALPVVFDQDGVGATPFQPPGVEDATYRLPASALRDLRFDVKTRFLGGQAELPDRRDFGLALDLGLSVPTGDELGFAGDNGAVFFPTAILDFHRCMFSAALNLGARIRTEKARLADLEVGHQGLAGLGLTGHFLKRRLLLSAEGSMVAELHGFDRLGFEYRGAFGWIPDEERSVTLWFAGGSAAGTGDLLGTPQVRVLLGLTYAPGTGDKGIH
jgi:hypothetical protein